MADGNLSGRARRENFANRKGQNDSIAGFAAWGRSRARLNSLIHPKNSRVEPTQPEESGHWGNMDPTGFQPMGGNIEDARPTKLKFKNLFRDINFFNDTGRLLSTEEDEFGGKTHYCFTALSYCLNRMGYYIDDDASDQSGKSRKCLGGFFASIGLLVGTMAKFTQFLDSKHNVIFFLLQYLDSICRGSGQVMFLNNPVTGLVIIAALFISDLWLAICALVGLFSSTTVAYLMGVNRLAIRSGLFGYNGILVGCGLGTFCRVQYSWTSVLFIIVFAVLSVPVQLALGNLLIPKWQVPPFTMPFNLMLFVSLLGAFKYKYVDLPSGFVAPDYIYETDAFPIEWDTAEFFKGWMRGISQVYLADYWVSGLIMVIGAALCSPIAATFALIGSAVGMAVAFAVGASTDEIYAGLWGYNPVLGSIAIGGMFYVLDLKTTILAVMCGVLCSLLFGAVKVAFAVWAIPAATLPFVLSAWVFVLLQGSISRVFPVKLTKITTPEGHLRKHIGKIQKVLLAQSQSRESESSDIPLADIP